MSITIATAFEAGKGGKILLSQLLAACKDSDKIKVTNAYVKGVIAAKREAERSKRK